MRRIVTLLGFMFCLLLSVRAGAEMANCDGPTTPEEFERREMLENSDPLGLNPIYSGLVGILNACESMKKKFNAALSALGASRSNPPTDSQIDEALDVATAATKSKPGERAQKLGMAKISASMERDRVAALDSSTASALQSDCTENACMNYREKQLNLLTSEVEKLNGNAEILAWFPKYAPVQAFAAAERMGWSQENGAWKFVGAGKPVAGGVTTLGQYLLSVEECKKLRNRLDQMIKTAPSKEPTELSFFEVECLPQLPEDRGTVATWRRGFMVTGVAPDSEAVQTANAGAPVPPDDGLSRWNAELVAEENRQVAEAEERKRVAAEQQAEEAAAQRKEQLAAAERVRQSLPASSRYSSVCARNEAKLQKVLHASGYRYYAGFSLENEELIRWFASLHAPCAADESSQSPAKGESSKAIVDGVEKELEIHRQSCSRWGADCSRHYYDLNSGTYADSTRNYMQLYQSELRKALSDPNYSADLEPAKSSSPAPVAPRGAGDATCEAKLKEIDERIGATLPRCGESATCNLQAAMWGLDQQISTIGSNCPSGKFASMLTSAREQLESVTTTCNQIQSGGRLCEPKL